ncbi:MAG: hypothetical protein VX899_04490, partial [Myxococcota bacterium]|nr:hypothetical protein [Myxococcota bacterium]
MSYHYRREPGTQGTIHTVDGPAQGQDLAGLLQMGRPPLRACLEIGSALADILTIAEEDQAIHGDINTGDVIIAPDGSVSLDGYGHQRRSTRAPEGRPIGPLSDVFGLGVVMHSLLSSGGLGMLPRDPDAHDDAVVDHVMDMDFGGLEGRRWLDDVRRFLCTVMAFDPQERPAPLDAANVLVRVAEQAPGPGVSEWAAQMVRGAPAPAPAPLAPPPAPEPAGPESLGGPRNLSAPMSRPLEARQAPASKGATTEMWTRERLAALLAEEDAEEGGWDAPAERLDGPRQATPAPAMPGWDAPAQPGAWDPERPPRSSPWEQAPGTQPWSSSPPQSPGALPGLEPPPLGQTGFDDPSPEPAPPFSPSPPPPPARGPAGRTAAP